MFSDLIIGILTALALQSPAYNSVSSPEQIINIPAYEDTYVRNGAHTDTNFGSSDTLELKGSEIANYERKIYLKFNIPEDTDADFVKAELELEPSSKETPTRPLPVMLYEVAPDSWNEAELTYNTQPQEGKLIATAESTGKIIFDITQSLKSRSELSGGAAFILTGDYNSPLRANFYTKDSDKGPKIRLTYGASHIISELPEMDGFGEGQDPWVWAKKMVENSTAGTAADINNDESLFEASDAAFVRAGKYADLNFAGYKYLSCDSLSEPADMPRKSYLKFDLTGLNQNDVGRAYLDMFITTIHDNAAHDVEVAAVADNTWSENTITWNNAPKVGSSVAASLADLPYAWIRFDLTDYVKDALKKDKIVSVAVLDTSGYRVDFGSKTYELPPTLKITKRQSDNSEEFSSTTDAKLYPATPDYTAYKTRLISSLKGFTPPKTKPRLSEYGGNMDGARYTATGFYYLKNIDGRWWFVDPEGYLFYNMGVSTIVPGDSKAENAGRNKVYGSYEGWADGVSKELKEIGFNAAGGWSDIDRLSKVNAPMAQSCIVYFLKTYMSRIGLDNSTGGNTTFSNGVMNVFDPDFETFCDEWAKENMTKYKDNPNLIGWLSDNELTATQSLLDIYLSLDVTDARNAYSYAAAWEWLRTRTGKSNPDTEDITDEMREDFRDFVYDRYFSVISKAIKKYDPNHLYMGCRFTNEGYASRGVMAAAGRYCDVITLNYYGAWTPEEQFTDRWEQWSGDTPFMVTEWYAMAYDSGLACNSGAGFRVPTQADRGKFYQNYALGLMEKKNCVGFDWFRYMDNDPEAEGRDSSNKDGNKGIYSINYTQYTELSDKMKEINQNAYSLISYFDKR